MCGAPGAAALGNGSKVSVNSQHEIQPAVDCESKSELDPDPSYESKHDTEYNSDHVSKSEPESDANYESKSEAEYESDYDSEAESEASYECDAVDRQMHTPLESRSAPAAISMALNIKAEGHSALTGPAMPSSHHSPVPVSNKDHSSAATADANVQLASMPGSSDGQCVNGLYSSEMQNHGQSAEREQETAQQVPAAITSQSSKQSRLSALIPSLQKSMRGSTGSAAASPMDVKATSGGQAAAAAALASPPDSNPDCSSQCKPVQRLKKLVLKVCPSCMRTGTHSHQQEQDVQPLPAAAAALHATQAQHAHQPQEEAEPKQAQDPQHAFVNSQLGVEPLPAAARSSAKQPEKTGRRSRMPSLTKLALLRHKSIKDQQASGAGQQVQLDTMPVQTSTVIEQQQQQQPVPPKTNDSKRCVSTLTGIFKPRKAASKQALSGAAGSLATPSLQDAAPAELIPAVRYPLGVAQKAGPSPDLQVASTAAAKSAIQVSTILIVLFLTTAV